MSLFLTLPDSEALISTIIRDATDARVYSSIPKSPTYPLVTVKRFGGIPAERHRLDRARIQVDVWGGTKGEASSPTKSDIFDIASAARAAIFEAEGQSFTDPVEAVLSGVEDDLGLAWLPDPTSGRDRYIFAIQAYITP